MTHYNHLRSLAESAECPSCGSSFAVEACPERDAVRCSRCGWERRVLEDFDPACPECPAEHSVSHVIEEDMLRCGRCGWARPVGDAAGE